MKFHILDHTGHSTMEFTEDQKAEAKEIFDNFVQMGFTPAHRDEKARDYHVSRTFKEADEILFVPQLKGG